MLDQPSTLMLRYQISVKPLAQSFLRREAICFDQVPDEQRMLLERAIRKRTEVAPVAPDDTCSRQCSRVG